MEYLIRLIVLGFFLVTSSYSHENKKHAQNDTTQAHSIGSIDSLKPPVEYPSKEEKLNRYKVNLANDLSEHLHNKIIHFPIAYIVLGFLFTLINFRWKIFDKAIKVMVIIAGLSSLAAFFSGNIQASGMELSDKKWILEVHENFGIDTIIITWVWILFLHLKPLQRYAWMIGFIAMILVLVTGFYGGIIAH